MRHFRFKPGRNCWRVEPTRRLAVLVDGEAYFAAVRSALIAAERQVFILAWDIHSAIELVKEPPEDGLPSSLSDLILELLERNPRLEVYILLWNYAPIYALEREPLFFGEHPWHKHPRLHFSMDNHHPVVASHHQKLVVIDGRIAFCGGFDLSKWRWDTAAHLAEDPRRVDADGVAYQPFHDVHMLADADVARALEELCLERWRRGTGESVAPCEPLEHDPWPSGVVPLLQDHECAIARTFPPYEDRRKVREVERLYVDMIESAERFVFMENQYLTSGAIRDALSRSLSRRRGPEVVIILPRDTGGWLEQHTMDVLRVRVLKDLHGADRHGRLRVYHPSIPDLETGCLMVHAKLTIVDDRLLRIGSSNLSNRSMGLDTECDLCVAAQDDGARAAIGGLRRRLLGMLLDAETESVAAAEEREGGLIGAIESLRSDGRTLAPVPTETDPEWERQLPDTRLIDPDRPLRASDLSYAVIGQRSLKPARRRLIIGAGLVALLLAMAAAWRWTPLGTWLDPQAITSSVSAVLLGPWGPLLALTGFVAGSLLAVPVTLLILIMAVVYGSLWGALYAMTGSMLAAAATYWLGSYLGGQTVERLSGGRIRRISERLARRGILTVVAVRVVPVAPFTVINLLAGASHIRPRDFLIGTLIGMLPGVAAMAIFAEGILAVVEGAEVKHFMLVVLGLVFIVALVLVARRMFARLETNPPS